MEAKPPDPPGGPGGGDPNNAATWYRAARAAYRAVEFDMDLYEHLAVFQNDPDRGPSSQARGFLRRYREAVDLTKRGARRDFCDFGPYDVLNRQATSDVGSLRALVTALNDDYRVQLFDGDINEAIEHLVAVLHASRHAASQRAPLPALIASAILHMADRMIQYAVDRALIGPGQATHLLRELEKFEGGDPFRFRQAMSVEHAAEIEHRIALYSAADGLQRFREDCLPYYRQESDAKAIEALENLSREGLDQFLSRWRAVQERIAAALQEPDGSRARAAIEAIDKEVKEGAHGPFARYPIGYSAWAFVETDRARKLLDDRTTMLKGLADGTTDPLSLANAACWYIRASVQIEQIDPDALGLIEAHSAKADPAAAIDAKLAEALKRDDVRAALERLTTASTIDRCDFSYSTNTWTQFYRPYHAGVLACGRLLAVDAMRLLSERRIDEAAARLVQLWRLSARLSGDGCISGSLASHRLFESGEPIFAALIERGLDPNLNQALRAALAQFDRADPFHYQASIASLRTTARGWLIWMVQGAPALVIPTTGRPKPPAPELVDQAEAMLGEFDADTLLTLQVISEQRNVVNHPQVPHPIRPPVDGLWPIFDVEALNRSREMLPALLQWAKMRALAALPQADLPVVAPIEARARQSIDDFRACLRRLGMRDAEPPATQP